MEVVEDLDIPLLAAMFVRVDMAAMVTVVEDTAVMEEEVMVVEDMVAEDMVADAVDVIESSNQSKNHKNK